MGRYPRNPPSSAKLLRRHSSEDVRGGTRTKVQEESDADDRQKKRAPEQLAASSPSPGPLFKERMRVLRAYLGRKRCELLQRQAQFLELTGELTVLVK